ncbi:hypothetical protein [Mucilaginibacter antarcticus]|uniref:hypothetical protein n=1 Tax=Mucilaginibacter antarcticus TaxID=1855725 RepID=UPI0036416E46
MKNLKIFIILVACNYAAQSFAQAKSEVPVIVEQPQKSVVKNLLYVAPNDIYDKVDKYPEYAGGHSAMEAFLRKT